jgi:hypothetical protein
MIPASPRSTLSKAPLRALLLLGFPMASIGAQEATLLPDEAVVTQHTVTIGE